MIIAVDGPAGAGKGTISRALAQQFSLKYIDTGLMYRALAYKALLENVDLGHLDSLIFLVKTLTTDDLQLPELRREEVGNAASKIAVLSPVREQITLHTRRFSQEIQHPYKGVVLDGRDIGTVVCPNADIKIYVTASPYVRAERRLAEMVQSGKRPEGNILEQIIERDHRDQTRAASPLVPAVDATLLDTSELSIQEACQRAFSIVTAFYDNTKELKRVNGF